MTQTPLEWKSVRQWRAELGLTQGEVAEMAHCSDQSVGHVERGEISPQASVTRRVVRVLTEFGVPEEAIDLAGGSREARQRAQEKAVWIEDGFAATAPKRTLADWRTARNLSSTEVATLSGVAVRTIWKIEAGVPDAVRKRTKFRLAQALRVRPDKLILPGDNTPTETEVRLEERLRSELRSARRALHKAHDFMVNDAAITFRYQDTRDALLPDIQRELRGT